MGGFVSSGAYNAGFKLTQALHPETVTYSTDLSFAMDIILPTVDGVGISC
jgi:hypothetical protein